MQRIFNKMKTERLSAVEKVQLREILKTRMGGVTPTYRELRFVNLRWFHFATRHFAYVSVLVVFVVFGGVSLVAERSLPGSVLYALKTGVNEPLRGAFAFSPEAKVNIEARLAERRLAEVAALTSLDTIQPEVREGLMNSAASHADKFVEKLTKLEDTVDSDYALKVSAKLEASLAHESSRRVRKEGVPAAPSATTVASSPAEPRLMMAVSGTAEKADDSSAGEVLASTTSELSGTSQAQRTSEERLAKSAQRITELRERIQLKAEKARQRLEEKNRQDQSRE
ncbi:MAG TPA: DUF5667 domain-containing protein [Candidatus Paceibacterota bacterium]